MSAQSAKNVAHSETSRLIAHALRGFVVAAFLIISAFPVAAKSLEQQLAEIEEVVPGNSYTKFSPALAIQSWEMAATVAFIQRPASCNNTKLVDTRVTAVHEKVVFTSKRKLRQGRWSEIWTFDKCGKRVRVRADFKADGKGTADGEFSIAK